jgi:hypothetical protein
MVTRTRLNVTSNALCLSCCKLSAHTASHRCSTKCIKQIIIKNMNWNKFNLNAERLSLEYILKGNRVIYMSKIQIGRDLLLIIGLKGHFYLTKMLQMRIHTYIYIYIYTICFAVNFVTDFLCSMLHPCINKPYFKFVNITIKYLLNEISSNQSVNLIINKNPLV